jgi:tripeptidyl-peptidase-1
MGVAQQTASTYWYVANSIRNNPFVGWVTAIVDESNPPQANSMSWGSIEQSQSTSVLNSFNTEAMKLGAIGVTMTISTGDDGVSNSNCACTTNSGSSQSSWTGAGSWTGEGYFPNFPATCPWVTAVGASMGAGGYPPAVGESEISCQSQLGGVITSGGGFSTYYEVPDWQSSFTSAYLDGVSTAPTSGYNKNGRAIPDMSMMGVYYQVVVGGSLVSLFGTSCSAPVTAAVVSLVNAARSVKGLSSIGFINPTLYANQV